MIHHDLKHLLDILGLTRFLGLPLILNVQGYIILPLWRRIRPQIPKVIIIKIRLQIRHIEHSRDSIISQKVDLEGIVIDLSSTLNAPSALSMSFDFLLEGNLSF